MRVKRFGILTSGGDAPGLNSAIRAVCRTAAIQYGMTAIGIKNGYRGLIENNCFELSKRLKTKEKTMSKKNTNTTRRQGCFRWRR